MNGIVDRIVDAWCWEAAPTVRELSGGLINTSYRVEVEAQPVAALQRLNTSVFDAAVHEDIEAVTSHLEARGIPTPRLIRTRAGGIDHDAGADGIWRVLSWIGDRTVHKVADPEDAHSAAALVARVHGALADFAVPFRSVRDGPHDTMAHMRRMRLAMDRGSGHRLADAVGPLAEEVEECWCTWDGSLEGASRVIHGDLKIANVRFQGSKALALVDLDTFQVGNLAVELGDAMRSWCNPATEDSARSVFDLGVFEASMRGYAQGAAASGAPPSDDEWDAIVPGVERIALELTSRFLRDALEERYFGFDPRFGGHGEHNLLRARGQLHLAHEVRRQRAAADQILARVRQR